MLRRPWIKDFGKEETPPLQRFCMKDYRMVAYYTDAFEADWAERGMTNVEANWDKLLELRIFNEQEELWLHRSRLGEQFFWRVASEQGQLPDEEKWGDYCFETRQLLDLGESPDASSMIDEETGLRELHTLGGRCFRLPISAEDRFVRIMNYVEYDEDGVANAADWRLIGFAKEGSVNAG